MMCPRKKGVAWVPGSWVVLPPSRGVCAEVGVCGRDCARGVAAGMSLAGGFVEICCRCVLFLHVSGHLLDVCLKLFLVLVVCVLLLFFVEL